MSIPDYGQCNVCGDPYGHGWKCEGCKHLRADYRGPCLRCYDPFGHCGHAETAAEVLSGRVTSVYAPPASVRELLDRGNNVALMDETPANVIEVPYRVVSEKSQSGESLRTLKVVSGFPIAVILGVIFGLIYGYEALRMMEGSGVIVRCAWGVLLAGTVVLSGYFYGRHCGFFWGHVVLSGCGALTVLLYAFYEHRALGEFTLLIPIAITFLLALSSASGTWEWNREEVEKQSRPADRHS